QRQLVLVTNDSLLQSLADEYGILWYHDEKQLRETLTDAAVGVPSRKFESPAIVQANSKPLGFQRWLILITAVLAVGLLYYVLTPKVTVTVTPELLIYQEQVDLLGTPAGTAITMHEQLPQLMLQPIKAVLETEATIAATGSEIIGTSAAAGVVVFINEGEQAVVVPKDTKVQTGDRIMFATEVEIEVPGRSTQYFLDVAAGIKAGQQEVTVIALEKGEQGNVAAGRIRELVDHDLGTSLVVRNPESTSGGASRQRTVVSETDLERGFQVCRRQAELKAEEILQTKTFEDESVLIPESVSLNDLFSEPSLEVGSEAQSIHIVARYEAQGQVFRRKDLAGLLQREIQQKLPSDFLLFEPKFEVEELTGTADQGAMPINVRVKAPIYRKLDAGEVAKLIAGLRLQDLTEFAKVLDVESVQVEPTRREYLPKFTHWIRVQIDTPGNGVRVAGLDKPFD
ncbi:MAG: hypothetical protein GX316_06495, partial [Firmicutes bacterium]|nr:hypothetical protein [Bacillota bacterium]